jgi:hypothetical protein
MQEIGPHRKDPQRSLIKELYVGSIFIATTIYHRPESALLISIISISIFGDSLLVASQSSFIGFERMKLSSLTLILERHYYLTMKDF